MTVDYAGIANADPGGTLEEAFSTMSTETKVQGRGEYRVTQLMMAKELGMEDATTIRAKLDVAVVSDAIPAWLIGFLDGPGIDINDPETTSFMAQLVTGGVLIQDEADALVSMGDETVPVWPRLKIGYIQNARQGVR